MLFGGGEKRERERVRYIERERESERRVEWHARGVTEFVDVVDRGAPLREKRHDLM